MADLMDLLYFEEGFSIRLNNDSDPLFFLVDYSSRSYPMNMANQHYHDFFEVFIALEDEAAHLINGRYLQLHKGDIVFLRPQMLHMSIYPKRSAKQRRIIINYNSLPLPGMNYQMDKIKALYDMDPPVLRLPPEYLSKVVERLNDLFLAAKAKRSGWQLEIYSLSIVLFLEIMRSVRYNIYKEEKQPSFPDLKMYSISEYIETHYMEPLMLQDIAKKFAISPFYLSHQFTKIMGISFVNYLQKVRIRYALQMLSYTSARIHDIIADCGFASSSQFNRTFSSFCNMSPSEFRKLGSADRDIIINSLDPERSEVVPAAFPPRYRTLPRKRRGVDGMKIGIMAEALYSANPAVLREQLSCLGVETVCLDIPRCFQWADNYRTLSDKRIAEIASENLDISIIGISNCKLVAVDDQERNEAIDDCIAAIRIAGLLNSPFVGILSPEGDSGIFASSLKIVEKEAEKKGISIAVIPVVGSAVDGLDGAIKLASEDAEISFLIDPLRLLHDDRENTFSFFEEVFSVLGKRIVALFLSDRIDGRLTNLGKGIMAKTYPHIAALLSSSIPLIRLGDSSATIADDILYIRRIFL